MLLKVLPPLHLRGKFGNIQDLLKIERKRQRDRLKGRQRDKQTDKKLKKIYLKHFKCS